MSTPRSFGGEPSPAQGTHVPAPELAGLSDYRVVRKLGEGGMGSVYLAHNPHAARDYVLKVIRAAYLAHPGVRDRFLREVRAAVALGHHPHIVTAYPPVSAGDTLAHVMEFVDGVDLARLVRQRGPLPVSTACLFVAQAASGLQHAHEHGLVHRDVKPHNLLLARVGDRRLVKVADFGLAKQTETAADQLTSTGAAMGTPDFMAPEQARDASRADIRADIYGLGCTLYFLLTGETPFPGGSAVDKILRHTQERFPALAERRSDVPEALAHVVARMTAKAPADRYAEPRDVVRALAPFTKAAATPTRARPPADRAAARAPAAPGGPTLRRLPRGRWLRAAVASGGALGILGVVAIVSSVALPRRESPPERALPVPPVAATTPALPAPPRPLPPTPAPPLRAAVSSPAPASAPPVAARTPVTPPDASLEPLSAPFDAAAAREAQQRWAQAVGVPQERYNAANIRLTLIPPGDFTMGNELPLDELLQKFPYLERETMADAPSHRVRITRPFYLGTFEVTIAQFRQFVSDSGYQTEAERDGVGGAGFADGGPAQEPRFTWRETGFLPPPTDQHPVVNVSWHDAAAFCNWLSRKEGRPERYEADGSPRPAAGGYRLPSEAEWEYACRAGTTTMYHHGDDQEGLAAVANTADDACRARFTRLPPRNNFHPIAANDGFPFTAPVGQFVRNAFGLMDMHGNVGEWCADLYDKDAYRDGSAVDPQGATAATADGLRSSRGGGWSGSARCRSARRRGLPPNRRDYDLGFRVALSIDSPP